MSPNTSYLMYISSIFACSIILHLESESMLVNVLVYVSVLSPTQQITSPLQLFYHLSSLVWVPPLSSFLIWCLIFSPGHAVTIIIVVCVGFLVFMVVLGVIRVRAAHTRAAAHHLADTEMAWDDTSLNITVNPMEVSVSCLMPMIIKESLEIMCSTVNSMVYTLCSNV